MRRNLPLLGAVLAAGLIGGGTALGIGTLLFEEEGAGGVTTVVERSVAGAAAAPAVDTGDDTTIHDIYANAAPGVVQVTSSVVTESFFGEQRGEALGSGFVIDKNGYIVTNYHVVQGAERVYVNFSSDDALQATVVGSDPATDLALLKIDAHQRALTPLQLGDSDRLRVGDRVVAIGNPFGLERSVSQGIVSALQRQITSPNNFTIDKVIQTDAAINQGNSGGPLLDADGRVIGVNTQIATAGASEGNVGIGFAVPSNTVQKVVTDLREHGRVEHAYLGIEMLDVDERVAELFNLQDEGVLIANVRPGSPADEAGLRGGDTSVVVNGRSYVLGGDVVVRADGRPVESADALRSVVASKEPGEELELEIRRDGETQTVTVELGRQPTPSG